MKKRILSLVVTLIVAVSVILGVSIFASADNADGLKQSAISLAENVTLKMEVAVAAPTEGAYAKITLPNGQVDATQLVATAPKNGDNYVFFAEIAVKDLAKDVTIEYAKYYSVVCQFDFLCMGRARLYRIAVVVDCC